MGAAAGSGRSRPSTALQAVQHRSGPSANPGVCVGTAAGGAGCGASHGLATRAAAAAGGRRATSRSASRSSTWREAAGRSPQLPGSLLAASMGADDTSDALLVLAVGAGRAVARSRLAARTGLRSWPAAAQPLAANGLKAELGLRFRPRSGPPTGTGLVAVSMLVTAWKGCSTRAESERGPAGAAAARVRRRVLLPVGGSTLPRKLSH